MTTQTCIMLSPQEIILFFGWVRGGGGVGVGLGVRELA